MLWHPLTRLDNPQNTRDVCTQEPKCTCVMHSSGEGAVRGTGLESFSLGILKSGVNVRFILGRGQHTMACMWGCHISVMDGEGSGRWVGLKVPT